MVHLARLAPGHAVVGALYDAYARTAGPVPFDAFLVAPSSLIGTEALAFREP